MTLHLNRWGNRLGNRWRRFTLFFILSTGLTMAFQNCGDPEFGVDALSEDGDALAAEVEAAPFAYDTSVNQLTYMSCTNSGTQGQSSSAFLNNNSEAFFTFRVSAFDGAGIKLNSDFIDYAGKELKNIRTGKWDDAKVLSALTEAPNNLGSQLQLAVRKTNSLQFPLAYSGSGSGFGFDHTLMFFRLDIPEVAKQLMTTIYNRMDEFLGVQTPERFIDGKLYYQQNPEVSSFVRGAVASDHMLTITYAQDAEANKSIPRLDNVNGTNMVPRVFGTGFRFSWEQGPLQLSSNPQIKAEPDAIAGITEYNLSTLDPKQDGRWVCKQLLIIEPGYAALHPEACPSPQLPYGSSDASLGMTNQEIHNRTILHLYPENWRVNLDLNCAVPLRGDCYYSEYLKSKSTTTSKIISDVDYTGTEDCGINPNGTFRPKECARHISVCFRL